MNTTIDETIEEISETGQRAAGQVKKMAHTGGPITEVIADQKVVPGDVWLVAAGASIIGSLVLKLMGHRHTSLFVGQWAPTFLLVALYQKFAKETKRGFHTHSY